jgi:two-component system heavy metal sensor histidine kinase CusS
MFWKSGKAINRFSLTTKLVTLYVVSTLSILAAVCLFLYPTFITVISQLNVNHAMSLKTLCYKNIVIALLFSSLGAILLGKMITKNSLNRIHEFSNKIEKISSDSLHERIHIEDWPKELKPLGHEFNLMLNRIETSFSQLSQFSSDIAHELRNPLNNLQGMTEVALTKEKLPTEYSHILESYLGEYQHLSKLVENLLFLARSDQNQVIFKKQSLHVRDEILKIMSYYQLIAEENQIEVNCNGDAILSIDSILFKRVINNVLSNALKYTADHGKIHIHIRTIDKQWVEITINDTGIGIDEIHLPKIFDRFYRIDSSRSMHTGGLELGLAIVKSIMALHKGKVNIKSELNVGTSIQLYFPCEY